MKKTQLSDMLLEQYILNELPRKKMKEIEEYLKKNPEANQQLDNMKKSNTEILSSYNADEITAEIKRRYEIQKDLVRKDKAKPYSNFRRFTLPAFAMATAAVILVLFTPILNNLIRNPIDNGSLEVTRTKGEKTKLYIYRKNENRIEVIENGSITKEYDLLQIAYVSREEGHGVILSIDGRGSVTLHYPEDSSSSTKLKLNKKILLPSAYELDDAPTFEKFFFITSKDKLNVKQILKSAKIQSARPAGILKENLNIDSSISQISFLVKKGE